MKVCIIKNSRFKVMQGARLSQAQRAFDDMNEDSIDKKVGEIVRYLLCADKKKLPVKKKDITDAILKDNTSRAFPLLLSRAERQLEQVFGLKVVEVELGKSKTKAYFLVNHLPEASEILDWKANFPKMGLLFFILAHIMMNQNHLSESDLWGYLQQLGIEKGKKHATFGDVTKLITQEWVQQLYLEREKKTLHDNTTTFEFYWGERAKHEIDKEGLITFLAELHGSTAEAWHKQFKGLLDS